MLAECLLSNYLRRKIEPKSQAFHTNTPNAIKSDLSRVLSHVRVCDLLVMHFRLDSFTIPWIDLLYKQL